MFNKILIPIDLVHESSWRKALPLAIREARNNNAQLTVMTVVPELDAAFTAAALPRDFNKNRRKEAETKLAELYAREVPDDIKAEQYVGDGNIYRSILKRAEDTGVDLIVMASHRPSLRDYLLGANAARVVRHARCTVMVVRE